MKSTHLKEIYKSMVSAAKQNKETEVFRLAGVYSKETGRRSIDDLMCDLYETDKSLFNLLFKFVS